MVVICFFFILLFYDCVPHGATLCSAGCGAKVSLTLSLWHSGPRCAELVSCDVPGLVSCVWLWMAVVQQAALGAQVTCITTE